MVEARKPRKKPRWKEIYENLICQLKNFHFGERFYTIAEVCEKYKVSHITATKILTELARDGFVEKKTKVGTRVGYIQEKPEIKLVIHDSLFSDNRFLFNPLIGRVYSGITSSLGKLKLNCDIVAQDYFTSIPLTDKNKVGFLMFESLTPKSLAFLKEKSLPFVLLHSSAKKEGISSVRPDFKKGAYLATKHLISLGHTRIGLITGPITSPCFFPRFQGYLKALREAKIKFDWSLVKETGGANTEEDTETIRGFLFVKTPPTAIFASSDQKAMHLIKYCHDVGIRIPEDLSIVGLDNVYDSSLTDPPLTTIDTGLTYLGVKGVGLLLETMLGKKRNFCQDIVIKPELVVRESTKKP
ncbi:MAG: substrate-binding domain-containing protein [Candidatus Omnitrophota bacterium]